MRRWLIPACALLAAGTCSPASAATLCVNPGGTSGCSTTIGAAVAAATAGDTIQVAAGTYKEMVTIGKPLSLVGAGVHSTFIDATGLANGVYVDGMDNTGLSDVVVSGFTIENANFEGILVANASWVTISDNRVVSNNKSLVTGSTPSCPGIPAFETAESEDCGEGIHLLGTDHSTVGGNYVSHNAGGILLSDETLAVHDNLITGNVVEDNPFDCGITLAAHPPAETAAPQRGVFHNTVSANRSSRNGLSGAGAGIGIFDSVPGAQAYANLVINNQAIGNGLPGVALHSHTPNQNLDDNVIAENFISGNAADDGDAATPGPTGIDIFSVSPVSGIVIAGNVIQHEDIDLNVNTPSQLEAHLNSFSKGDTGVSNLGTGAINATGNWWGCSGGPGAAHCATATGTVVFDPWLTRPYLGSEGFGPPFFPPQPPFRR
jgi:parallel beta-helix repeat protein